MERRLVLLAGAAALLAACKSRERAVRWGAYQEPVAPQDLPPAAGLAELRLLWRRALGDGPEDGYGRLRPAYDAAGDLYASGRSRAFKLAAADGQVLWRRDVESDFGAAIFSGVGAHLETGVAALGLDDGRVLALDVDTGETLWEAALGRQISAIPAVGNARVVARASDGQVAGLDAATGRRVWSFEREAPALSIHGDSAPLISGDAVITGLANGKLVANSVVTGREYWETEVSFASGRNELERLTDADSAPLVAATTLYTATYQGHVAALNLQDAALKWRAKLSSRLPLALAGGRLAVTGHLGEVALLDAATGEILWTQEAFRGHGMSGPLVIGAGGDGAGAGDGDGAGDGAGARVVVGDAGGRVHSLDAADGRLLERRNVGGGAVVALVAGPGQFVVFSAGGRLSAWALRAT